jgi:hypothetical protein
MRQKHPPVLRSIRSLRNYLKTQSWMLEKYCHNPIVRSRKLENLSLMQKKLDEVEAFCRPHIPESQWEGVLE